MATALEKTIEFLGNSSTAQAIDVLLAALELDDRRYQAATTRALLNHSSARGQMALIRRLPELTVEARELIRDHSSQLFRSFNHCLEHADSATRTHVLEFICSHELFAHIPALVASLQSHTHQPQIATQDTLRFLTQRLYDCSRSTAEPLLSTHTAADLRSWTRAAFDALAAACDNLEALPDPRFVVETALALGDIQHPTFEHLFDTPTVRRQAANCLMTSCHPGVMQRILDILGTPYPHAAALKALNQRDDLPFICFLLRWFRDQPERTARNNLKLINTLPWIPVEAERLPQIPASLQPVLPTFVARTGVPHEQQDRLSTWLVRHGRAAARTAADGILQRVDSSTAEDIVMSALADPDPSVQAWATSRLRSLKTHHALHPRPCLHHNHVVDGHRQERAVAAVVVGAVEATRCVREIDDLPLLELVTVDARDADAIVAADGRAVDLDSIDQQDAGDAIATVGVLLRQRPDDRRLSLDVADPAADRPVNITVVVAVGVRVAAADHRPRDVGRRGGSVGEIP